MGEEIARFKQVNVRRPEREYLLQIRAGEFEYQDLVNQAEEKIKVLNELFKKSDLPDEPDPLAVENLLIEIRERFNDPSNVGIQIFVLIVRKIFNA